jgi:hypothetical protein
MYAMITRGGIKMRQEVKGSELCPCGSGKRYIRCCKKKTFKFVRDAKGIIYRRLPNARLPDYMHVSGISSRKELLSKFLDINAPDQKDAEFVDVPYLPQAKFSPEGLEVIEAMKRANIAPELIYAYQKTGLMVTKENSKLRPDIELQEFYNAVDEYLDKFKKDKD